MGLSYTDLSSANLRDANLSRADLSGADLRDANLRGANLNSSIFIHADLSGAGLSGADLSGAILDCANLSGADLRCAKLSKADLSDTILIGANLRFAYLSGADLSFAILSDTVLSNADLSDTDLSNAILRGADFRSVDLSGARGLPPICCPEEGSFIGWKKCVSFSFYYFTIMRQISTVTCFPVVDDQSANLETYIVKLLIPEDARRSSATGRKCRCDKALVLGFYDLEDNRLSDDITAISYYDTNFKYRVGETVSVPDFDENRWNECASGIHFFITRQEAIDYKF